MPIQGSQGRRYPFNRGKHVFVVVELLTYADETGTHGDPSHCIVSGFIGSPRQWEGFDASWNAVLADYGVSEFHSKEFFGRRNARDSSKNPFATWDDTRALSFLRELVEGVLLQWRLYPVGGAVNVADFMSYTEAERRYFTMGKVQRDGSTARSEGAPSRPYQLALVNMLYEAIRRTPQGTRVHFIMDMNSKEEPLAVQTFREIRERKNPTEWGRLGEMRYAASEQEPGLQAADLYNYVWHRYIFQSNRGRRLDREETCVMNALKSKRRTKRNLRVWERRGLDALLGMLSPEQRQGLKE